METGLIKAQTSNNEPVLLKIHEAPFYKDSPVTLLSEYQIRENGFVIDSVAKNHQSLRGKQGMQRFELSSSLNIDFEDREGLMGFELLPIEYGDEDKYNIISITSPKKWIPQDFCGVLPRKQKVQKVKTRTKAKTLKEQEPHKFDSEDVAQTIDNKDEILWFERHGKMEGPGPPRQCVTKSDGSKDVATSLSKLQLGPDVAVQSWSGYITKLGLYV